MRWWLISLVMAISNGAWAAPLPADLAAAAKAFDQAQVASDGKALATLLADDYLLINSRGERESKVDFIHDYTAPGFSLDPFTVEQPVEKIWADGAVLGGVVTLAGTDGGKRYSVRLRFADIWAKRNGRWQVIYTQVNHVADGQ